MQNTQTIAISSDAFQSEHVIAALKASGSRTIYLVFRIGFYEKTCASQRNARHGDIQTINSFFRLRYRMRWLHWTNK